MPVDLAIFVEPNMWFRSLTIEFHSGSANYTIMLRSVKNPSMHCLVL